MDEIIEVKVNKKLYARFCAFCVEHGWNPEDITCRFFEWCIQEPEEAGVWLQSTIKEQERR